MINYNNIYIKNIYYMLSYAFRMLNQKCFEEMETEAFDNISNLFAAILSKGISQQLKRGLYKEYNNINDDLSTIKGKININKSIDNIINAKRKLHCEFDELTEDNTFNKILKTTALLLIKSNEVNSIYKNILKQEMLYFSNVSTIELTQIKWQNLSFHRNNQTYRILISICYLITKGLLMTTKEGNLRTASFIDDQRMCRLYEKFLLEYYKKEFPQYITKASQIKWALMESDDITMLPELQTDVMLIDKNNQSNILIIDAKFYSHTTHVNFDKHTIHSNNYNQIYVYVRNKDDSFGNTPHKVSGMLLYALTEDKIQPNETVTMASGNKISVKTLDLNCDFSEIKRQLNNIIENFEQNII